MTQTRGSDIVVGGGGDGQTKTMSPANQRNGQRSSCTCCPYGFHIDTDFVRYCDALISALYATDANRSIGSIRRKFRFYDFSSAASRMNGSKQTTPVAIASNSIFETQTMLKKFINGIEDYEDEEDSVSTRDSTLVSPSPSSSNGTTSTFTKSVLAQIRTHLAQSLQRVKVLEAEVEKVPQLERQIDQLSRERDELRSKLDQQLKTAVVDGCSNTEPLDSISSKAQVAEQGRKTIETRSIGTLTRMAPLISYRNRQSQTDLCTKDMISMTERSKQSDQGNNKQLEQSAQTETSSLVDSQIQTEPLKEPEEVISMVSSSEDKFASTSDLNKTYLVQRPKSLELGGSKSTLSSLASASSNRPDGAGREPILCDRCSERIMLGSGHSEFSASTPIKEVNSAMLLLPKSDSGISVVTPSEAESLPMFTNQRGTIELHLPSPVFGQAPMAPARERRRRQLRPLDYQSLQPSAEVKEALRVVNECLNDETRNGTFLFSKAITNVKRFWFKMAGQQTSDSRVVEYYLDCFEKYSTKMLEFVVNLTDTNGNTAMHYALSFNNFDIVSVLLDSKVVNVNLYNKAGYTATMLLSLAKVETEVHRDVAERFFRLADVNMKAKQNGQTALMLAASHGKLVICSLLVQCEAAVNLQDNDGSTALMCAAEHGYADIVALLLSSPDCDPRIEDNEGSTALKIALINGHNNVGVILYAGIRSHELSMGTNGRSASSLGRLNYSISPAGVRRASTTGLASLSNSQTILLNNRHSPPRVRHISGTSSVSMPSSPSSSSSK